ncbi:ATP-binding protein [Streptomyces sp. NBC_00576]|uniref:ATP-binding protein n=1 Tax=Streptomyces sp. NBC_00576 TaxID=2903665 RepID=UPI002E806E30|nr:ATP-binding protein [Streptomyces sp. NBC_00576]WUB73171.1 ATP-binding protein [Streptomyces sp. NBC_00576]
MPTAVTTHQRRDTFHVPKRKQSVPDARSQVRKILSDWGIDSELACDVAAVSTELVANAIQHCRVTYARIEVTVCMRGDGLLVEVSDPDRGRVPALCLGDDQGESGRGLVLVAGLAEHWGHELRPFTKCVWAEFSVPEGTRVPVDA